MNLLQIVQQVCNELGINAPSAVVSSQDPQIKQLYALLNRHGHDLCRRFEWQDLDKEYLLTTVAYQRVCTTVAGSAVVTMPSTTGITTNFGADGPNMPPFVTVLSVDSATQVTLNQPATGSGAGLTINFAQVAYPLPTDWLKQIPQTEWDRTNRWPMMGPKSPQEWQSYKSGIVYAGPRERFRIQGGFFQINPPPPNGLTFAYEYISSAWVISASGVAQTSLLADTDNTVFDDSLMVVGLKMRWRSAKGLDFGSDLAEYNALLSGIMAQDKSAPVLSLAPVTGSILLSEANIQDGNWAG